MKWGKKSPFHSFHSPYYYYYKYIIYFLIMKERGDFGVYRSHVHTVPKVLSDRRANEGLRTKVRLPLVGEAGTVGD